MIFGIPKKRVAAVVFLFAVSCITTAEATPPAAETARVIAEFPTVVSTPTPLPSAIQAYTREIRRMKSMSVADLKRRYKAAFREFTQSYPEFSSREPEFGAIENYKGDLDLIDPEVYGSPFLLITPIGFDHDATTLLRSEMRLKDKTGNTRTIPVLTVRSAVEKRLRSSPINSFLEPYLPTVNARVFGFTHAQLIPELSAKVEPSAMFDYNGLKDWSQHSRLKRLDQVTKPIALTNFAHRNGNRLAISAHPDFSVAVTAFRQETARMTFFLWRTNVEGLPDLIYQFEFEPAR
jgi:hypothetical protein